MGVLARGIVWAFTVVTSLGKRTGRTIAKTISRNKKTAVVGGVATGMGVGAYQDCTDGDCWFNWKKYAIWGVVVFVAYKFWSKE